MRKHYSILILALFAITMGNAQQLPLYSNYFFTPYIYNPALSGLNGRTEVAVVHKTQWTDMQGAPTTSAIAANGDLKEQKFGWSVYAYRDQTDIVSRSAIYGSYAYHVKFSDKNSLSLGLSAGYMNNAIDQGSIHVEDQFDPLLFANLKTGSQFDLNFGVNLRLGDFSIGASVPQLLGSTIEYSDNYPTPIEYELLRHYIVHTQYDWKLQNGRMVLSPFVMLRAADNVKPQVDAGLMFDYTELFFVGASYRSSYAVTANVGVHLTENLTVGYAHDFSTSEYASTLGSSNEIMLQWRFGSSKKDKRLENEIKKLKDKQNRSSEDTENLVNERLDEFKDEIRRENAKNMEEQKKEVLNEVMTLYDPNNPPTPNNGGATSNQNGQNGRNSGQNQQNNTAGTTTAPTNNTSGTTNNTNSAPNNSVIKGYDQKTYPKNTQAGSPGYYVTAGVFGSENNARKLMSKLQNQNVDVNMFRDASNGMYYVFVMKFGSYSEAQNAKESNLNSQYNGKLWIKVVE